MTTKVLIPNWLTGNQSTVPTWYLMNSRRIPTVQGHRYCGYDWFDYRIEHDRFRIESWNDWGFCDDLTARTFEWVFIRLIDLGFLTCISVMMMLQNMSAGMNALEVSCLEIDLIGWLWSYIYLNFIWLYVHIQGD